MSRISDGSPLAGAGVDTAADLLPIVDMSEAGAARNKKITIAEFFLAIRELVDDRMDAVLVAGSGVSITYDDTAGTLTIDATAPGPGDITGFNEAVDDRVAALIVAGSGLVKVYDDGAGTLTLTAAGASFASAAEVRTGTEAAKALSPDNVFDAAAYVTLNDSGGNIAVDLSSGFNFSMTMDGDYTLSAPSNGKPGQTGCIVFTQDGSGTQTLAYNAAWKFAGGTDPVLSTVAGTVDILFYQVLPNGTDVYANLVKAVA